MFAGESTDEASSGGKTVVMAGEGSSMYALDGGDGGHMDLLGGASQGGSRNNGGGNINFEGGAARGGKGGSVNMASGYSAELDSGSIFMKTPNGGAEGSSGQIELTTGTAGTGNSGAINIGSQASRDGQSGDVDVGVGAGDGSGGDLNVSTPTLIKCSRAIPLLREDVTDTHPSPRLEHIHHPFSSLQVAEASTPQLVARLF